MRYLPNAVRLYSTLSRYKRPHDLLDLSIDTARSTYQQALPALCPRGSFNHLPSISKWFRRTNRDGQQCLNVEYLSQYGSTYVPLEFTFSTLPSKDGSDEFTRAQCPLSDFLTYVTTTQEERYAATSGSLSVYLAQCPISSLPPLLQIDLPTPDFVIEAGRGDVYDSSIWMGPAPTFTPLHKDPNANLFVQMAGTKTIRLFEPSLGDEIFRLAQQQLGRTGSASIRGEEMMQGEEKQLLRDLVWERASEQFGKLNGAMEATLGVGDGMFIPKGWWHSVIGTGSGMVGSANWWFR